MAEPPEFSTPIVRSPPGFQPDKGCRNPGEELKHLASAQTLPDHDFACRADPVNLKDRFCDVQSDRNCWFHGSPPVPLSPDRLNGCRRAVHSIRSGQLGIPSGTTRVGPVATVCYAGEFQKRRNGRRALSGLAKSRVGAAYPATPALLIGALCSWLRVSPKNGCWTSSIFGATCL
jgi:hypothetical protein